MILLRLVGYPGMINLVNLLIFFETFLMAHVFGIRLKRRNYFVLRLIGSLIIGGLCVYFFPLVGFNNFWISWLYSSFSYLFIMIVVIFTAFVCYKGNLSSYVFLGVAGYAAHHVRSCIEDFTLGVIGLSGKYNFYEWQRYISFFITSIIIFGGIIFYFIKNKNIQIINNKKRVVLVATIVIVLDIFVSCFAMFPWGLDGQAGTYTTYAYNFITSSLALGLMLGLINRQNIENEITVLDYIIKEQSKQYKINRDAIESINIKAHDLKHHLNYMISDKGSISNEEVEEIKNKLNTFNSMYRTNNEVIDVVLSSRAITCEKHHIELTCIVDGKLFNFMKNYELYALFENALDNAIDAVRKIQNKDDRFIFVSVKKTNNIVCLHVENSYDGKEIILENGLPLTSQDDKTSHGFGVRSIKRIVDKYKGFMNINYANNVFYLDVCFPINLDSKNA